MQRPARQGGLPKLLQAAIDSLHHPDLRRKLLFTFGILILFRFLAHIPIPGVDVDALQCTFDQNELLGMLDMFSGGALGKLGIVALGVYPYITASIIMQLLVPIVPRLQMLAREGEEGRNKINQYTHWLMVPLAMFQGYGQLVLLSRAQGNCPAPIGNIGLSGDALLPTVSMVITLTAGSIFLVWLGERITEHGIGNGISIIIFGGIVAGIPSNIYRNFEIFEVWGIIKLAALLIAIALFIVYVTEAHRRIPVQYSRSTFRGGKVYRQSGGTHIPLKVNSTGMIPLIFAMAVMVFPGTIASYFANASNESPNFANFIYEDLFNSGGDYWWFYWGVYFLLVVGFTFFYGMITFQQQNIPDNLQKQGGFIPGIRPGKQTAVYLDGVHNRLTWGGAMFLGLIAIMPLFAMVAMGSSANQAQSLMLLSSAGLLIVVGVVLDTMRQMEAQLLMRHYEGFIK